MTAVAGPDRAWLDQLEAAHVPVEWQECDSDGVPDLDKPLPPFCRACTDDEYVAAIEFGDTIDQGDPVVSWPCVVVPLLAVARERDALRAAVEGLAEEADYRRDGDQARPEEETA